MKSGGRRASSNSIRLLSRHAMRASRRVRAGAQETARRALGRATQSVPRARQSSAAHRRVDGILARAALREPHAAGVARARDPARRAADALGIRVGATPQDGARERRARGADRRARELARLGGIRRARKIRACARRGGDRGARERRGLRRSLDAFRSRGVRRARAHRCVLRDGRTHARRDGGAARARDARLRAAAALSAVPAERRSYRYYEYVMAAFVTTLICSNLIGPAKIVQVDGLPAFGAGLLFFPISYVFGDVLTEVYGYAQARRVIWAGFAGLAFASFMASVVVALPPAPFWHHQAAYEVAFGTTWRIAGASMFAYFCGEFANSFVLAKMKLMTEGRWLWTRTIGSTLVGEAVDSALFYPLAFYGAGIMPNEMLPAGVGAPIFRQGGGGGVVSPPPPNNVGARKRAGDEGDFDRDTHFSPLPPPP